MIERIDKKVNDMAEKISYNTSTGSFARDIISSVAIEMTKEEEYFKENLYSKFLTNATGNDLDINCNDKGIIRLEAKKSSGYIKVIGTKGAIIKEGYRVKKSNSDVEYVVLENKTIESIYTTVKIECLKAGVEGNAEVGEINKFGDVYLGLTSCQNIKPLTNGRDTESDIELRKRAEDLIKKPRISWNKYIFEDKAKEIEEIDKAHCVPRSRGAGTIDIIVTQKDKITTDSNILKKVKDFIELEIISDIDIKVKSITLKDVNFRVTGILNSDFDVDSSKQYILEKLNSFFFENIFMDKIYYYDLVNIIYDSPCFSKIEDITVNDSKNDIVAQKDKLYRVGTIEIN